jgi:lipopolysaccharide/colanic/teichoic acid biosynthesis glycosyltransferase
MAIIENQDRFWHNASPEWELHADEVCAANLSAGTFTVANRTVDDLLSGDERCAGMVQGGGKRIFDLFVSLLLLCLTGPMLACAMLAIWLESLGRSPVIYRQTRVGLHGRLITVLKLRTMHLDAERDGPRMAARNDSRITRLGRILRRSRIDELPQLINVLQGEMSLIGPRPERPEFVAQYERQIEGYALRHWVKPGITGLAQVRYSYAENLQDTAVKLYFDLDYIRNCSLLMDLAILLKTLPVVFTGWGAR